MTTLPRDSLERVGRLIFLLEEFVKPHEERHPDVRAIVQAGTKFLMNYVCVGRKDADGNWIIEAINVVGLAALDRWFNERGLNVSVITHPTLPETLDPCGVMFKQFDPEPHRIHIDDTRLSAYFGFRPLDWCDIIDPSNYIDEYLRSGNFVRPHMVRERILKLAFPEEHQPPPPSPDSVYEQAIRMAVEKGIIPEEALS